MNRETLRYSDEQKSERKNENQRGYQAEEANGVLRENDSRERPPLLDGKRRTFNESKRGYVIDPSTLFSKKRLNKIRIVMD